ncbi:MAG: hypothetical protein EPO25_09475 [Gammaproteobacteria bacterium]|nr:MAG: hypothetical protein EPO25_09475 [Gammaproteobacteria bacterium]
MLEEYLEAPVGTWIIDHKSDVVNDLVAAFTLYRTQLATYAEALAATGRVVAGVALHWIRRGQVVVAARGESRP